MPIISKDLIREFAKFVKLNSQVTQADKVNINAKYCFCIKTDTIKAEIISAKNTR